MNGVSVPSELNLAKTTFLVADTKAQFRDVVQSALLGAGAKNVKHATSVEKAVETLNRYGQEINCVICDWDMAPTNGLELLRMIRARKLAKTSPRTPVVILTARADSTAVKAALAMDVNGFAIAPLSFEKLVKTVSNALTRAWLLQSPEHYLAVPGMAVAPQPPEPRVHTGNPPARKIEPSHGTARPAPSTGYGRVPGHHDGVPKPRPADELRNVHMCSLDDVTPGQILARDLRDREGHLLLSTGAVLKPTIIERLKHVAQGHSDSYHLWVGEREADKTKQDA